MPYARQRDAAPPQEPDLPGIFAAAEETRAGLERARARAQQILDAIEQGTPPPDWVTPRQLALLSAGLRQGGCGMHAWAETIGPAAFRAGADETAARLDGFAQGTAHASRGRHRASRGRKSAKGQLELIPGGRTTAAAVALAASVAAGAGLAPGGWSDLAHFSPVPVSAHAGAFAGLGPTQALPVPLVPSPVRSYVPRHAKPSMNADAATLAPPPPVATPVPSSPAPSVAPSAPVSGTLDVQQVEVTIGASGTAQIAFTTVGGPLEWHASSSPGLTLSSGAGLLGDRQSAVITVSVDRGVFAGSGQVTITARGQQVVVPVTWAALPGL